ncbi:Uu.00g074160.m01.CDS01 [Anthostomella pinea]|uniref:Uu.00g074160.m01.CDS01 n=1 Tax=Anthostomella pinea TaxID=933095 RepID=A0AAI8VVF7_9PEZI|nr:Uu.00g074160.m01.CDS01 [Anthostomella pinea]
MSLNSTAAPVTLTGDDIIAVIAHSQAENSIALKAKLEELAKQLEVDIHVLVRNRLIDTNTGRTLLHHAARNGHTECRSSGRNPGVWTTTAESKGALEFVCWQHWRFAGGNGREPNMLIGLKRHIIETLRFDFRVRYPQTILCKLVKEIAGSGPIAKQSCSTAFQMSFKEDTESEA